MPVVTAEQPVVDAARDLAPLIRRDSEAAEDRAEMTAEVRSAAGAAGMFRLLAPREVGGVEASLPLFYAVLEELAAADPSVAWHAANSMVAGVAAASLGEAERNELFRDGDHPFGFAAAMGGTALPVDGGFRLSGHWGFVTGIGHARWCVMSGVVTAPDDGGQPPDIRVFVVRRDDLEVHPTFREATAMRGTGSNAASVDDLFVPEGYVFRWTDPVRLDRPLYRLPFFALGLTITGAVAIGILRGALAGAIDLMAHKASSITGAPHYDQPRVKETIANADAAVRALRAGMQESTTEVWEGASAGPDIPLEARARLYASALYAMDTGRRTVSDLYARSSSLVYAGRNAVERSLRDIHALAANQDTGAWRPVQMTAGRVLLGHGSQDFPRF